MANKPAGTYTYKLRRCTLITRWGEPLPQCNDSGFGNITVYVDDPSLPIAAPYHEQLLYEYEVRTGDFEFDGFKDILVERLTLGAVDGSMQTVIIRGGVGGQTVIIPTPAELANARTYPINTDIKPGGSDQNIDGYADILLMGLDALNSPAFPYDCLILYASGNSGVAQPLGHQFMDEDYLEFFGNILDATANPSFYVNNVQVTYRPDYDFVWSCEWRYGQGFSLYDCRWRIGIVAYTPQVSGYGYHLSAPAATNALDAIETNDFSNGNPWFQLSEAMKTVLGVNSFGYQNDGSRRQTNRRRPGESESDEENKLDAQLWATLQILAAGGASPLIDPSLWEKHHYDVGDHGVGTNICSTVSDVQVPSRRITGPLGSSGIETIPKELCTIENVFCWAKRRPAPRSNDSESTIGDQEQSVLDGNNPIQTHVFDAENVLVNETLRTNAIPGVTRHVLHDPLQTEDCARSADWSTINTNQPRCAYVHRETYENGNDVFIRTHGEGHNRPLTVAFNEIIGTNIFGGVDRWIQRQLATEGACTDDP